MKIMLSSYIQEHIPGSATHLVGSELGQALAAVLTPVLAAQPYHDTLILDFTGIQGLDASFIHASFAELAYQMQVEKKWPQCFWIFANLAEDSIQLLAQVLQDMATQRNIHRNFIIPLKKAHKSTIPIGLFEASLTPLWSLTHRYTGTFGPRDIKVATGKSKYWVSTQLKKLSDLRLLRRRSLNASWGKCHSYLPISWACPADYLDPGGGEGKDYVDDSDRFGLHVGDFWLKTSKL